MPSGSLTRSTARRLTALVVMYVVLGGPANGHAQGVTPPEQPAPPTGHISATAQPIVADAATFFPGSVLISLGDASPLDEENVLTFYAVEQGVTLLRRERDRVVSFAAVVGGVDGRGFDWNNRVGLQAGVKYLRSYALGVVQAGVGYAYEKRLKSSISEGRPLWFASYWFGWSPPASKGSPAFPGSSWATMGTYSPTEPGNVIATMFVEQGVTVLKTSRFALAPYVEHTLVVDSMRHPWNNRHILGEGLKLRVAMRGGVLEAAGTYKHERRWLTESSAAHATAAVTFWYGWDPSRRAID